jgi:cysteine desulfurase
MRIYLDNAATTAIDPQVIEVMTSVLSSHYGNPSSVHAAGRDAKALIETSRRSIAKWLHCQPSELIFTSGGTEADNMAMYTAVRQLGAKRIITSQIEHHAVGNTAEALKTEQGVELAFVNVDNQGNVDLQHLENLLSVRKSTLVSLMHANNEIGTLLPIQRVVQLCKKYDAYFHSDTIQGIGHYAYNLNALDADFITCAAHKFHGPKGIGFLYVNKRLKIGSFIHGGTQERSLRGGTENVVGICGLAKALELAYSDLEAHQIHIQGIKTYFMQQLSRHFNDISYHGETNPERSLYTILNVSFPLISGSGMLLFSLDLKGISASGGSACSSGAIGSSHVLTGIQADLNRPNVRFSFSKFTTREEIDRVIEILKGILPNN